MDMSQFTQQIKYTREVNSLLLESFLSPHAQEVGKSSVLDTMENEMKSRKQSQEAVLDYLKTVDDCCRGQRLCVLDNGLYGLGPREMQKGDIVCLLDGGKAPFILRENHLQEDTIVYNLIGDSYNTKVMYGEAVRPFEVFRKIFCIV